MYKFMNEISLRNREDIVLFEEYIQRYEKIKTGFGSPHIPLVLIYDTLQNRQDIEDIFSILIELRINYSLLQIDNMKIGGLVNKYADTREDKTLNPQIDFEIKMDLVGSATSFILRYPIIWENIMEFLIILYAPDEYSNFIDLMELDSYTKRLSKKIPQIPNELLKQIDMILSRFEITFGAKDLRKGFYLEKVNFVTFSKENYDEVVKKFLGYWNFIVHLTALIGDIFIRNEKLHPLQLEWILKENFNVKFLNEI